MWDALLGFRVDVASGSEHKDFATLFLGWSSVSDPHHTNTHKSTLLAPSVRLYGLNEGWHWWDVEEKCVRGKEGGRGGERKAESRELTNRDDERENKNGECLLWDTVSTVRVIISSFHWSLVYNVPTTKNNNLLYSLHLAFKLPRDYGTEEKLLNPLPPPLLFCPPSSASISAPTLDLHFSSDPSLPRPRWVSLGGHGVAAVWVPLHVTDTPNGLHLGVAGAKLIEMPVVTLLQQILAATVARELVTHPAGEKQRERRGERNRIYIFKEGVGCKVAGVITTENVKRKKVHDWTEKITGKLIQRKIAFWVRWEDWYITDAEKSRRINIF